MPQHDTMLATSAFPPAHTWLSFVACGAFEAILLFLCYHPRGPELAKRGPSILGRWLRRKEANNTGGATPVKINPPSSVEQSWRLGVLHERFFKGAHSGDESTLREAGEVLGVGRALTESEFLSLASLSERAAKRSWSWCSVSNGLLLLGIVGAICTIGPVVYNWTAPFLKPLVIAVIVLVGLARAIPMPLRCLFTLVVSMALVCDGFRAADKTTGRRITLAGAVGACATMRYSTIFYQWSTFHDSWFWAWWLPVNQGILLLGFYAAVLAPIAVKFDYSVAGFLAVSWVSFAALHIPLGWPRWPMWEKEVFGSLVVMCLFGLAVFIRIRPRTLQPFCSGVMMIGVFYLNFNLHRISYFRPWHLPAPEAAFWPHLARKLATYPCLLGTWILGESIGCKGFANNVRFFGFLNVFVTTINLLNNLPVPEGKFLGTTSMFFMLWRAGLYLHRNRDFFPSLWTLDAELLRRGGKRDDSDDAEGDRHPEGERPTFEPDQP